MSKAYTELRLIDAMIIYANRHADALEDLALGETEPSRKEELKKMARICRKVPAHAPATFHEMLQPLTFPQVRNIFQQNAC